MAIRYLGSKARVVEAIAHITGPPTVLGSFVDAFSGTGAVASAMADRGWSVVVNDTLVSAATISRARLLARTEVPFVALGGYQKTVSALNDEPPREGFLTRAYSPKSALTDGVERRYFTVENAMRLDAWRARIDFWLKGNVITSAENDLLLADLLMAANSVANTAGTYGSYLKNWSPSALKQARLSVRELRKDQVTHSSHVGRAEDLEVDVADTLYLDPPYTKRQYAAYYHVLETVVLGDSPTLSGSTGLRPWKHLASDFSYASRALDSIIELVRSCRAERVLLSYSNQGHADLDELESRLAAVGDVTAFELGSMGRYTPNSTAANNGLTVKEHLIEVVKTSLVTMPMGSK